MGSIKKNGETEELRQGESFYKWFLEIEEKLFQDFPDSVPEEESDDDLSLLQKRKIERVKKLVTQFENADILLELAEDKRTKSHFVSEYNPLEAIAVLGTITFFHSYVNQPSEAKECGLALETFVKEYKMAKYAVQEYVSAMESVLLGLGTAVNSQVEGVNDDVIKSIQLHFLSQFPEPLWDEMSQLTEQITNTGEWSLNKYHILRSLRLRKYTEDDCRKMQYSDLSDEKQEIEKLLQNDAKNPRHVLAICQFLTDYLSTSGQQELDLVQLKLDTDTEIVQFIRNSSENVTEKFPSFLRANFLFAEIFANQLPITRQDREYAKSLLQKALNANPNSSKINHKLGLFLIKSRQFTEARTYIQTAIKLNPTDSQVYNSLAKLLLRDTIGNKEILESFFNTEFSDAVEILGPENELSFWKGCYFFKTGDKELAINLWVETILEFYVTKPELDLETVLPFKKLVEASNVFLWFKSTCTLESILKSIEDAISQEKTRRRVVFHRLKDLVREAISQ